MPSFIESGFTTRVAYEAALCLSPEERDAAFRAAATSQPAAAPPDVTSKPLAAAAAVEDVAVLVENDGMLHDGSNPEGVDPSPPLGWSTKADLTDVVVVSMPYSPPCAKVRYHLAYHGVPFRVVTPKAFRKGKGEGDYTKVPAIFVGGRQVNDSYIITKHLTPALYGSAVDEAWDARITYGLQLAIEVEAFEDRRDYGVLVTFGGFPAFVGRWFPWALPLAGFGAKIRAKRAERDGAYGPLRRAEEYAEEFRAALGSRAFFAAEAAPGAVDVSFFATLAHWRALPSVRRLLDDSGLGEWWARMEALMPEVAP